VAVTTKSDLDTAIANLVQAGTGSLLYSLDSLFASSFDRLAALVLLSQKVAVSAPVESVFMEIHISLGG
jgi:hypothetical protein